MQYFYYIKGHEKFSEDLGEGLKKKCRVAFCKTTKFINLVTFL